MSSAAEEGDGDAREGVRQRGMKSKKRKEGREERKGKKVKNVSKKQGRRAKEGEGGVGRSRRGGAAAWLLTVRAATSEPPFTSILPAYLLSSS